MDTTHRLVGGLTNQMVKQEHKQTTTTFSFIQFTFVVMPTKKKLDYQHSLLKNFVQNILTLHIFGSNVNIRFAWNAYIYCHYHHRRRRHHYHHQPTNKNFNVHK